jgi:hypothetical protein
LQIEGEYEAESPGLIGLGDIGQKAKEDNGPLALALASNEEERIPRWCWLQNCWPSGGEIGLWQQRDRKDGG